MYTFNHVLSFIIRQVVSLALNKYLVQVLPKALVDFPCYFPSF